MFCVTLHTTAGSPKTEKKMSVISAVKTTVPVDNVVSKQRWWKGRAKETVAQGPMILGARVFHRINLGPRHTIAYLMCYKRFLESHKNLQNLSKLSRHCQNIYVWLQQFFNVVRAYKTPIYSQCYLSYNLRDIIIYVIHDNNKILFFLRLFCQLKRKISRQPSIAANRKKRLNFKWFTIESQFKCIHTVLFELIFVLKDDYILNDLPPDDCLNVFFTQKIDAVGIKCYCSYGYKYYNARYSDNRSFSTYIWICIWIWIWIWVLIFHNLQNNI